MSDLFRLVFDGMSGPGRPIARDELPNGLTISTVTTRDMGPETAILGRDGHAIPVERYADEESAREGHERWSAKGLQPGDTVTQLGYGDLVDAEEVTIP